MTQQINLYQPAVFIKTAPFAARRLLLAGAAWLVMLLLGYGIAYAFLWRAEERLLKLEVRQEILRQRLTELRRNNPERTPDLRLSERLLRLQAEKAERLPLLTLLADRSPEDFAGFSEHLQGLAREDLAGIWLREIAVAGDGQSLLLVGSALRAELVPRYVQRLNRQAVFAGLEFARLSMNRSEERSDAIDFVLRTTREEDE